VKSSRAQITPAFLDLQGVAEYTGLSVRVWRDILKRPDAPAHYRPTNGKILLRRDEVDEWIAKFRCTSESLEAKVNEVLNDLTSRIRTRRTNRRGRA